MLCLCFGLPASVCHFPSNTTLTTHHCALVHSMREHLLPSCVVCLSGIAVQEVNCITRIHFTLLLCLFRAILELEIFDVCTWQSACTYMIHLLSDILWQPILSFFCFASGCHFLAVQLSCRHTYKMAPARRGGFHLHHHHHHHRHSHTHTCIIHITQLIMTLFHVSPRIHLFRFVSAINQTRTTTTTSLFGLCALRLSVCVPR